MVLAVREAYSSRMHLQCTCSLANRYEAGSLRS